VGWLVRQEGACGNLKVIRRAATGTAPHWATKAKKREEGTAQIEEEKRKSSEIEKVYRGGGEVLGLGLKGPPPDSKLNYR